MDPQQELFSELLTQLKKEEYAVYDGFMPPEGTAYPFVYLADNQQTDDIYKNAVTGSVFQTIHVWHSNPKQRGTVSGILLDIKKICYGIERTKSFGWNLRNVEQRIISDNTTKQPLLHGVLSLEFKFS